MKRNPRKLRWTKAARVKAGKEMVVDSTLLFGARRNEPQRYDRDLVAKTIEAMRRISDVRARRERVFYKRRMAGKRERELAQARKLVAENEHLLPRLRGSEKKRLEEERAAVDEEDAIMDVDVDVEEEDEEREVVRPQKIKSQVFGGEKRRLKVRTDGGIDEAS
jgi:large subunit ribosomal protein L24e